MAHASVIKARLQADRQLAENYHLPADRCPLMILFNNYVLAKFYCFVIFYTTVITIFIPIC